MSEKPKVREIVFHGCTLRDMCPNCCATLTAHEMLAYNEELGHIVKQESFLVALQRAIAKTQGTIPTVTSIVSSLIRYYPADDEPISWLTETHTSLLNPREISPHGITPRFVNQFRFPEKMFLEHFIPVLTKIIPNAGQVGFEYNSRIFRALDERLNLYLDK